MTKTIDARGLSCPQPVLMTLAEIKTGRAEDLIVTVDNEAAKENVSRAAKSKGWRVMDIEEQEGTFNLRLGKG